MHTGTLISELMATVERVEEKAEWRQIADDRELHAIVAMQIPFVQGDQIFMGAA
ncbi:MAG: hypothetical protein ABSE44_09710 [Candidatus Sulfotelmatobacter sp.]|jgi:hypothetical protein